jgi:hypothetical protein
MYWGVEVLNFKRLKRNDGFKEGKTEQNMPYSKPKNRKRTCKSKIRGCIQKFPDWPPGSRTANGRALCH